MRRRKLLADKLSVYAVNSTVEATSALTTTSGVCGFRSSRPDNPAGSYFRQ